MQPTKIALFIYLTIAFLVAVFANTRYAHSEAIITVENLDDAGEGFNDNSPPDAASAAGGNAGTTLGQQRLIAFRFAANIWGTTLDSSVEIKIGANFNPLFCFSLSAVLGSAGPISAHRDFPGAPVANTWYPAALANSLAGTDLNPASYDIGAEFNSSIGTTCSFPKAWYYGLDANPPADTIDFVSIVLHELAHGLGFITFVNLSTGAKLLNYDDTFMQNLEDHSTGLLYPDMTDAERITASTNTGNLHWVGSRVIEDGAILTSGRHEPSGHVEMYAPASQQSGSSVSHFSTSLSPDQLMEPSYTGPNHEATLARALVEDIGWIMTSQSTITVTSPDGGEDWEKYSTYAITWTSSNLNNNVKIDLYSGGSPHSTIVTSTSNDGSYSWKVPLSLVAAADYRIRISSVNNAGIYDESDAEFTISDPDDFIEVNNPNSSTTWRKKRTYDIQWTSFGISGNVKIELLKGVAVDTVISGSAPNSGSYSWTIPESQADGSDYSIKITSVNNTTIWDESDEDFKIAVIVGLPWLNPLLLGD